MANNKRWQVPGNGNPFDTPLESWEQGIMSQRSIGVLQFILQNNNKVSKKDFENNIKDYLNRRFQHNYNNSISAHFYRPLEFIGLIRNYDNILSISIDGRNFLSKIEENNFDEAKKFYILQILKTKYPNTATKNIKLNLFPFRIIFKLLLEIKLSIEDFEQKIPYIKSLEDIVNYSTLKGEKYSKWNSWVISYFLKWGILQEQDKTLQLTSNAVNFLKPILDQMSFDEMFFMEENVKSLSNNINRCIKRDTNLAKEVVEEESFQCFIDKKHITFASKYRKNYVEGHHIIPISLQNSFQNTLDCKDNIIALCPNCHKAMHLAVDEVKKYYLNKIVESKQKLLNFNIDYNDLLEIYL